MKGTEGRSEVRIEEKLLNGRRNEVGIKGYRGKER